MDDKMGWIRLHRRIEDNKLYFAEPFTKAQAWIDLILLANHGDGTLNIRGNLIPIKRGQVGRSEVTLGARWKWSRNKVRRFLNYLKTEQQIEHQKNPIINMITLTNYDLYQSNETLSETPDDTPDGHQTIQQKDIRRYINNNVNKNKNDNNDKNNIPRKRVNKPFVPPTEQEVIDYCKENDYTVDTKEFIRYYAAADWHDKDGKPVRSWKQKIIAVWSKNRPSHYPTKPERIPQRGDLDWLPTDEEATKIEQECGIFRDENGVVINAK